MRQFLSASLVLYNTAPEVFEKCIKAFLNSPGASMLLVVDNSEAPTESPLFDDPRVMYRFNNRNIGFGAAHNLAIKYFRGKSEYHLLLNPDIEFSANVIPTLLEVMETDSEIGVVMPKVIFPDGRLQPLCKRLPTPMDLIFRRFLPLPKLVDRLNEKYELRGLPQNGVIDVPSLSGCFLLVRTMLIADIGGFDPRYFMYLEDVDLVRRIGDVARTVYVPAVCVQHLYARGSYRNWKLLRYHIRSAIRYFNKWGWFWDATRRIRNHRVEETISRHQGHS